MDAAHESIGNLTVPGGVEQRPCAVVVLISLLRSQTLSAVAFTAPCGS